MRQAHIVAYDPDVELGRLEDGAQRAARCRHLLHELHLVLLRQVDHLLPAPQRAGAQPARCEGSTDWACRA